ncbi:hypothetical protein LB507_002633, partial [Fusarium sp. FIESC RH6]
RHLAALAVTESDIQGAHNPGSFTYCKKERQLEGVSNGTEYGASRSLLQPMARSGRRIPDLFSVKQ